MDAGWIVLKTKPKCEILASESVLATGVESYMPLWRPATQSRAAEPMFPGYVFAHVMSPQDLLQTRSAIGVMYALPRDAQPTILPEPFLDELRIRLKDRERAERPMEWRRGERVRIIDGPFRSVDALFDCQLNAVGRVRLLLHLVHGTVRVSIPLASVARA